MTFFTFDDHLLPQDTRVVLQASALLEITEFRLFELAHSRWFGEHADPAALEKVYVTYMFRNRAPTWVRQFARDVVDAERDGHLDPVEFGVHPVAVDDSRMRRGIRITVIVAGVLMTLYLIAVLAASY